MLKSHMKRRAAASARAVTRLAQVKASIVALKDDDLLDWADIFKDDVTTPLMELVALEMRERALSL